MPIFSRGAAALAGLLLAQTAQAAEVAVTVHDAEGRPVEEAVVFVSSGPAGGAAPEEPAVMDQVNKEFVPHVLAIQAGGKVRFPNKDDIHHHIYSFSSAKTFELPLYRGEPANPVTFETAGVVKLGCNIHDWMNGVILVSPTPYFAITDTSGKASLSLPEADVQMMVFHERSKDPVDATVKRIALQDTPKNLSWTLNLKPPKKPRKSGFGY